MKTFKIKGIKLLLALTGLKICPASEKEPSALCSKWQVSLSQLINK
ncbi:hypothetical protein [Nafulsella turpanensis]|nr:hypothetical protein [Nafulsella turpanensis]